jgi:hypothetical protein
VPSELVSRARTRWADGPRLPLSLACRSDTQRRLLSLSLLTKTRPKVDTLARDGSMHDLTVWRRTGKKSDATMFSAGSAREQSPALDSVGSRACCRALKGNPSNATRPGALAQAEPPALSDPHP